MDGEVRACVRLLNKRQARYQRNVHGVRKGGNRERNRNSRRSESGWRETLVGRPDRDSNTRRRTATDYATPLFLLLHEDLPTPRHPLAIEERESHPRTSPCRFWRSAYSRRRINAYSVYFRYCKEGTCLDKRPHETGAVCLRMETSSRSTVEFSAFTVGLSPHGSPRTVRFPKRICDIVP